MKRELAGMDIVVVASVHNPSIISPDWLKRNSVITEEPSHFVHTPDFSLFDSASFFLVAERERLQVTAKKRDRESARSLSVVVSSYINLLPHISYKAIGMNFLWTLEAGAGERVPKIDLRLDGSEMLSLFGNQEVRYGGIVYAKMELCLLRLVIEPQKENVLLFRFNYHYELAGMEIGRITALLDGFSSQYEDSQRIFHQLCQGGNK